MKSTLNPRPVVLAAIILAAGLYRLIVVGGNHAPLSHVTPLGAMALFGGCYYQDKWKAYLVPLLTLWLTDIVLNRFVYFNEWVFFYGGFVWVYGSFALMVLIGGFIKKVTVKNVIVAAIAGAFVHWIVSDLGACAADMTNSVAFTFAFEEFGKRLYAAIPAMGNLMIGNLVFGALLFGSFELMQRKFPSLQLQHSYQ